MAGRFCKDRILNLTARHITSALTPNNNSDRYLDYPGIHNRLCRSSYLTEALLLSNWNAVNHWRHIRPDPAYISSTFGSVGAVGTCCEKVIALRMNVRSEPNDRNRFSFTDRSFSSAMLCGRQKYQSQCEFRIGTLGMLRDITTSSN